MAAGSAGLAQESPSAPPGRLFTLAGGDISGNYFAIARALCRELNRTATDGMRCSPEATPGSVYNLAGLRSGEIDFAVVQSDWLAAARAGTGRFAAEGPLESLRGVSELYREAITMLVTAESGIEDPGNLDGKRIDIGQPASGRRATMERIFEALAFDRARLGLVSELPTVSAIDELCDGKLDAVVLVAGHPDPNVARAVGECGARILPLAGTAAGDAIGALGDYLPETIAAEIYPSLAEPVDTFGVTAALVTLDDTPDAEVAAVLLVLSIRGDALSRAAPVLSERGTAPGWSGLGNVAAHAAAAPAG
jgi:hypothetical protein